MTENLPPIKPRSNLVALDDKDVAIANYIFYLLAPFNGFTGLLGAGLAFFKKGDEGTAFDSHFTYQIRSFIYGILFAIPGFLVWFIGLGKPYFFMWFVWWMLRASIGLKYLLEGKPLPNPETLLV